MTDPIEPVAPEITEQLNKITINGQEYDPTEAQEYIETGRKTRELEKQYNTSFDKVWPEYGKSQAEKKQLTQELEQARNQLATFQSKKEAGTETQTDTKQAREAAKKLGIILDEDIAGYVKKDDLDKYFEERLSKREAEQKAVNQILETADKLEKEIDGSDGRPKFNKKVVLAYASAYQIADLQKAYEEMYPDALKSWKDQQIASKKQPSLKTLPASQGNKQPKETKVSKDNVKDLLKEALYGTE